MIFGIRTGAMAAGVAGIILIASRGGAAQPVALDSAKGLQPHNATVEAMSYLGKKGVRVMSIPTQDASPVTASGGGIVLIPGISFHNGTIELDVAGKPQAGAPTNARGFVGVAFRANGDGSKYECFYVRPTNGRAEDQLRRNHSTQYISFPDFEWQRLRAESPGVYESYVDLEAGAWTHIRVEVSGVKARLFVNGGAHPALVVNDLKMGNGAGGLGLWIGNGSEAYFSGLRVE